MPLSVDGSFSTLNGGRVWLNADGLFSYQSPVLFIATDSFTYVANDADPGRSSNAATVSIVVSKR
jgi:hypothetical protein